MARSLRIDARLAGGAAERMTDPLHKARVLVVDERSEMAELVSEVLAERGYDAVASASGRTAIERLRHERFDAVITDLRMRDVDGLSVLAASRALDPTRPVIVMTAHAALHTALLAFDYGAYRYVTKPFRVAALAQLLDQALAETRPK